MGRWQRWMERAATDERRGRRVCRVLAALPVHMEKSEPNPFSGATEVQKKCKENWFGKTLWAGNGRFSIRNANILVSCLNLLSKMAGHNSEQGAQQTRKRPRTLDDVTFCGTASSQQVASVAQLLESGNTLPFIARYRKEATGGLDEVALRAIASDLESRRKLDTRRAEIVNKLEKAGALTPKLTRAVAAASSVTQLDDLYLPYKTKRTTRGV
jgi:hypothetical protein